MDKKLRFIDGNFRVLMFTDMQDTVFTSPDTIRFIRKSIEKTKPNLIVATGDQIKGYTPEMFLALNKRKAAKKAITALFDVIDSAGIPFTVTFGNHDVFGDADEEFQWGVYSSYKNFLQCEPLENCGPGDLYIPVCDGNKKKFGIYLFNTHAKENGAYIGITKNQVEAYNLKSKENKTPAIAFYHIPPKQLYSCLKETSKRTKGAVEGAGDFKGRYFVLPEDAKNPRSFMGESIAYPGNNCELLEAFVKNGDVIGLFFGHDHNNSFMVDWKGIKLGYTQGCGMNTYGPGLSRGAAIFDIPAKDPKSFTRRTITYKDLFGDNLIEPCRAAFMNAMPSSMDIFKKRLIKTAALSGAAVVSAFILRQAVKRF